MDWHLVTHIGLLTLGGLVLGYTVFRIVRGNLSARQIGANVCTGVGSILVGFTFSPQFDGADTPLSLAGVVCLISSSLMTARELKHKSERGRVEGPR